MKVLVVDDDLDILEVVNLLLSMNGFIVKTLSRTERLHEEASSFNPGLILLDINIKGYDGREICKQLKSPSSQFRHIPVILFSAMNNLEFSYPECEANDFVAKPFESIELVRKIKKHIKIAV